MSINTKLSQLQEASYNLVINNNGSDSSKLQINPADVHFFSILWDINEVAVEGFIAFRDTTKITEIVPPNSSLRLQVVLKDSIGGNFEFNFVISSLQRDLSNGNNIEVKMSLVDEYFNYFANTYLSKGFKNKKVSEILQEILNDNLDNFITKKAKIIIKESEKKYEDYLINSNKSLLSFLYNIEKYDNMLYLRSRDTLSLTPKNKISELCLDLSKKCLFTANPSQIQSPLYCYSFNINSIDKMTENMVLAKTKSYTLQDKNIEINEHFIGKNANKLSLNTIPLSNTLTKGIRTTYLDKNIMDSIFTTGVIQQNSIDIKVNGMFFNRLLNKVGFDSNSSMEDYKNKMPFINGNYYITKIYDIIENGMFFTQNIYLTRVGVNND